MGSFNHWTESHPMQPGENGTWYIEIPEAKIGDEYRYLICCGEQTKLLAFHRLDKGGPGDDVVVVANFENQPRGNYNIGFPRSGPWRLRLNSIPF
jgi:1,4-alpha-glucan branching enzyme